MKGPFRVFTSAISLRCIHRLNDHCMKTLALAVLTLFFAVTCALPTGPEETVPDSTAADLQSGRWVFDPWNRRRRSSKSPTRMAPYAPFQAVKRSATRPACQPVLNTRCAWYNPFRKCGGGASCTGAFFNFYGAHSGQCICPTGTCAKDGKCVASPEFWKVRMPRLRTHFRPDGPMGTVSRQPVSKDPKKIFCPVLAAMWNAGGFEGKVDELGRVSRLHVQQALVDTIGISNQMGFFFGIATAGYRDDDPQVL